MKIPFVFVAALAVSLTACREPVDGDPASAADEAPVAREDAATAPVVLPGAVPVFEGDPRIALAAQMPDTRPEDLRETPVPGLYEVVHDGEINYVSADGQYVIAGNLYKVTAGGGEFPNLTELRKRELRLQMVGALPEREMIVFGDAGAKDTVTVFTDVDCQWCQHMHSQIAQYNKLGIRVRYLAFPRTGPGSSSARELEAVWCAKDRQAALTAAKLGEKVESRKCESPVERHYELGKKVGLTGTPGVILATGELIPGYLPPKDLLKAIEDSGTKSVAAN